MFLSGLLQLLVISKVHVCHYQEPFIILNDTCFIYMIFFY